VTREQVVQFFEAREAEWAARDADALAAGHAVTGTAVSPMFGSLHGRTEIANAYRRLFTTFPDWETKTVDLIIDGNHVAQHFVANATHVGDFMGLAGTNRHGRLEGVLLHTMEDGLILHEQRLYDYSALLIQIGVLRSKPAV